MSTSSIAPAHTPPPGQVSNFVDPPTIAPAIIAALTVCLTLTTISVVLRSYAQWSLYRKLIWADYWTIFGWMFQAAFTGFLAACIPYGAGRHMWDVTKTNYAHISFLLFINYILYGCAILGPKMSILHQLIAIFVPRGRSLSKSTRWFYWATIFMMAVNFIYYFAHNIALIFQCDPIDKGWKPTLHGTCIDQAALLLSSGPFNIISDFLIFILPLSIVWRLKLPAKTRLELCGAFTIGLFGCLCSAVRVYYSQQLSKVGDSTVLVFQNQLWANAEVTAAILIANIIILPRFFRRQREKSRASGSGSEKNSFFSAPTLSGGSSRKTKHQSLGSQTSSAYSPLKYRAAPEPRLDVEIHAGSRPLTLSQFDIERGDMAEMDSEESEVREALPSPPPAVHSNHRNDIVRGSPGPKTRWYSDEEE